MSKPGGDADLLGFEQVVAEEQAVLHPNPRPAQTPELAALCLSGGGIRSASFALGVLQGLARFHLLREFHYLSTVSGGGYIGSWLSAWRKHADSDAAVFAGLDRTQHPTGAEAAEIVGLRASSNYLTPKLGILSADTWAALALVVRNILLNWLVFGPFFLGVLLLPKLCELALQLIGGYPGLAAAPLFAIAAVCIVLALAMAVRGRLEAAGRWVSDGTFVPRVLLPLVAAAMALTGAAMLPRTGSLLRAMLAGAALYGVAWALGAAMLGAFNKHGAETAFVRSKVVWWTDLLAFMIGGLVAGALLGIGLSLRSQLGLSPRHLVVFGIGWVMLAFAIGDLVFVGLNSFARRGDQDREWLARFSGWILAAAVSWSLFSAIDLYMGELLEFTWAKVTSYLATLTLSGAVTLFLGPSHLTGATTGTNSARHLNVSTLVSVAAVVFALCLAGALSLVDTALVEFILGARDHTSLAAFSVQLVLCVALIGLAVLVSVFVNVNRFSLHALYRNRLVRAFLGSARLGHAGTHKARRPDPFTQFDQTDNVAMASLLPGTVPAQGWRLFHVVNIALNVVSTKNLAWQERKAESFTVSPLHAGNPIVSYRRAKVYGGPDGISLGTAMAISGAAVSPNSGYHSSPLVGMLMLLFNVRLGWWLGNPLRRNFRQEGPVPGLRPVLQELAGQTTDTNPWVYLSDGGHFENLGLYEMVRRKCRCIVVSDAGCDPGCAFEDLGNAVRKIYIDLGVSIDFHPLTIAARKDPPVEGLYCGIGTITYPGSSETGWLLYIKPGYHGIEPADIRSYALANTMFPHETTADQWFTESQFEAYRALGAYIAETICTAGAGLTPGQSPAKMDLAALRAQAEEYVAARKGAINDPGLS